jgi:hypothetical protein
VDLPVSPDQTRGVIKSPAFGMFIGGMNVDIWIGAAVSEAVYFWEHETAGPLPVVSVYQAGNDGRCSFRCTTSFVSIAPVYQS